MAKYNDIQPNKLIHELSNELKNMNGFEAPEWAIYVKTGMNKERTPVKRDWWQTRIAAVLRSVANLGPIGVSKLRTKYGGKHRRGHKPAKFARGSGNIIRKVLQQLEKANLIQQTKIGVHKGRVITKQGALLLNKVAEKITNEKKSNSKEE
jgi:small subunit ribosomal protein S19e